MRDAAGRAWAGENEFSTDQRGENIENDTAQPFSGVANRKGKVNLGELQNNSN